MIYRGGQVPFQGTAETVSVPVGVDYYCRVCKKWFRRASLKESVIGDGYCYHAFDKEVAHEQRSEAIPPLPSR